MNSKRNFLLGLLALSAALAGIAEGQLASGLSLNFVAEDPASGVDDNNWNSLTTNSSQNIDFVDGVTLESVSSSVTSITKAYRFTGGTADNNQPTWNGLFGDGVATTWEFWIKPSDTGGTNQIITESGGSGTGYAIYYQPGTTGDGSGTISFTVDGGGVKSTVSAVIDTSDFRHVTLVYDANFSGADDLMEIHVDGSLVDDNQSSTTGDAAANDLDETGLDDYCGGDAGGFGNFFNSLVELPAGGILVGAPFEGDIAVFRVWGSIALNSTEIGDNYAVLGGSDEDPPVIDVLSPADGATGTYPGADLVAIFDEDIALTGGGSITITDLDDASDNRTINLPNAGVTVAGDSLTIDLSALDGGVSAANLEFSTNYEVNIGGLALRDTADTPNAFGGTSVGDWNFQTVAQNLTAPTLTGQDPADEATNLPSSTSIVATFDQNVLVGTGNITIVDLTDGADTRTIAVSDTSQVSFSGTTVTVNPSPVLSIGKSYAVQIASTAVKNFSEVTYAGIADTTTWNFSIIADLLLVYEPFDYSAGGLNGATGSTEFGFSGAWTANGASLVIDESLFSFVARDGGSIGNLSGSTNRFGGRRTLDPSTLSANGLLSDGSNVYFSVDLGYDTGGNLTNSRLVVVLGTEGLNTGNFSYYYSTAGATGLGITLGRFGSTNGKVVATQVRDSTFGSSGFGGNVFGTEVGAQFGSGQNGVVVGKITWGATPGDDETLELYRVDPSDPTNESAATLISTLTVPGVDQTAYDTISWARGDKVVLDEIRYGTSWASVTPVDAVDPLLVSVSPTGAGDPPGGDDSLFRATFDEPVEAQSSPTGSIIFRNVGDDSVFTTIAVTDDTQVSFSGKNLDITPALLPVPGNSYYIEIEPGALQDPAGNPFAGFTGSATWSFTTDSTSPVVTITDNSVNGEVFLSLQPTITYSLTFDEAVTSAVTTADFGNAGSAAVTIDSVTQTAPNVIQVAMTATETGTLNLVSTPSASFSDLVGNTLNGPLADDSTIVVRDISQLSSQLGILNLAANGGVNPSTGNLWKNGDTYRLAFVTSGLYDATSNDIATYNTLVQNAAGSASAVAGLSGGTWKAIASAAGDGGSIPAVDARTNTSTNPASTGEAIFRLDGVRIANNYSDLWDGAVDNNISFSEKGTDRVVNETPTAIWGSWTGVWTGTTTDGTASNPLGGGSAPTLGLAKAETGFWESRTTAANTNLLALYGLSDPLTVTSSVPGTLYDTWAGSSFANPFSDTEPNDNPDGDNLPNLLEFAFGTDPTASDAGSLAWDGSTVTPGSPVVQHSFPGGGGVDFAARFIRRVDHGTSGSAAYAWRFSSDLTDWESSDGVPTPVWLSTPTQLDTFTGADGVTYELVEVTYPFQLDTFKKARFFQVVVSEVP